MIPPSASRNFTVFELVNERLQEIYVGRTSDMIFTLVDRRNPAPAISHWNPADVRPPRSIEFELSEREAERFIAGYVLTPLPRGWRFLI